MCCWILFASILLRLCVYVHQWYWPVIFFLCDIFVWCPAGTLQEPLQTLPPAPRCTCRLHVPLLHRLGQSLIYKLDTGREGPHGQHYYSCILEWLLSKIRAFPGGSDGKESVCNAGDLGLTLGQEDPLEKEMATCSSVIAWKIPWTEEPSRLQSIGSQRVKRY